MHARRMNDVTTWQLARSRDRVLPDFHGSVWVAFGLPTHRTHESVLVRDAPPHKAPSSAPPRRPPWPTRRAATPPASASPAPVVSTTGRSVRAGPPTTPSSM